MGDVFILNVSIILFSGFIAGCVCKYFKISPLIGYLLVGALIGPGGFDLMGAKALHREIESEELLVKLEEAAIRRARDPNRTPALDFDFDDDESEISFDDEIAVDSGSKSDASPDDESASDAAIVAEKDLNDSQAELSNLIKEASASEETIDAIAEFGCLLLLFAIGIEFTFDKLAATAKYMFVGGLIQMTSTIAVTLGVCLAFHMSWQAGLAIGCVVALSSTALVYRSMADVGQADTKRAQATLGLLIFQDVALVPILLVLPRILGASGGSETELWVSNPWIDMGLKSATFCAIVLALKNANMRFIIPRLASFQSNDMVILYAIVVLAGMCLIAALLGLTPALGALAAGIALGENRLTHQIDALVMPFREAFSAMFFISLGMLTDFAHVFQHPFVCLVTLVVALSFKSLCATVALKACGMDFRGALAYGTSISQIGELAFMILALAEEDVDENVYDTILFISVASLVLTPNIVKIALTKFGMKPEEVETTNKDEAITPELRRAIKNASGHVVVVGAGHIGKRVADELIALGASVCLIDFNPVNLHPFKQNGTPTVVGDGADQNVLRAAGIERSDAVFVTVPRDDLAINVVRSARDMFPTVPIIARSRYNLNVSLLKRAGATRVFCEEEQIANELVDILKRQAELVKRIQAEADA